ncbi:PLC-like phosphodiesterase [Pholiota conissans]|uniref:PLC-like phosphodiesterase n=1 Tax=Pholiota conissans TaxID=109636 RepID=A0A9P5Z4R6_9AGAR|nr:PLC-like phosphodiesterase [Pholiota conissans]
MCWRTSTEMADVGCFALCREQLCNGHAELCDRKYGNTTFLGSHDSFAVSGNPFALARNQEVSLKQQLSLGVRMLQAQGHMVDKELHFCHTTCGLFDGGSVEKYLRKVKRFLDSHPNEVLTLIFTNPEGVSVQDVWKPIFDKTGVSELAYGPPLPIMSRDDWPTLGEMIESGKRVVVFMDHGAENRNNPSVDFILPQFQMMWEDKYDPTNSAFPCKVDRTSGPLAPSQQLSLINHNLNANIFPIGRGILIPDRLNSPRTNSISSISKHSAHCAQYAEDRNPNFVLLDYVNVGQGLTAVNRLNGIEY